MVGTADTAIAQLRHGHGSSGTSQLPLVQLSGSQFTADGKPIILRGCNLGCWLLFEPWMLTWRYPDQYSVDQVLIHRFGRSAERQLMDTYRSNFIRNRDFKIIKSAGFNLVRLPFNYQRLEHTQPPYTLRHHPLKWLDRAVGLAARNRIYVILDMHGAPGRQSTNKDTGRQNRDKLWSSPLDQKRTIALWRLIARHFRNNTAVAGYDLLNEPWGNFHENMVPKFEAFFPRVYKAIRRVDMHHIIFMPGVIRLHAGDISFWGSPASHGWQETAYTTHFYPGLFGSPTGLFGLSLFIHRQLPPLEMFLKKVHAAFYLGEFNVMHNKSWAPAALRRIFDTCANNGWAATMWSYKLLKPRGGATGSTWFMVSNRNNIRPISLKHSSYARLHQYFASMGTMPLAINKSLWNALTAKRPPRIKLPPIPPNTSLW